MINFSLYLKWFEIDFLKIVGSLKYLVLLKWPTPLKCLRCLSSGWVGSSGYACYVEIFTQIWFWTLLKPKLFDFFFPINTFLLTLRRLVIGEEIFKWLKGNHIFSREGFLERKPKVSHYSQSLIQWFDLWILV